MQRHLQRHAVVGRAWLEPVVQRQPRVAEREVFRIAVFFAAFAGQQVGQRPVQRATLVRRQRFPPRVQTRRGMEVGRYAVQIPARLPVLIGDQAGPTQLRLFLARLSERFQVVGHESGACVDFAGDQALPDEEVVRLARRDAAVVDRLFRRQHQPEQADLLGGQHLALRARPVRVEVPAQQKVRQLGDHPVRFDRRQGHAPHLLGIQQVGRQQPRRRPLGQR